MKKALFATLLILSFGAHASCPAYAPYGCKTTYSGKMLCGCGVR